MRLNWTDGDEGGGAEATIWGGNRQLEIVRPVERCTIRRMVVTALIISSLALLAAGVSSWFTCQQAQAAKRTLSIEAERRHDERTPQFHTRVEDVDGWHWLRLSLRSTGDLAHLSCELIEARGIEYGRSQNGVDPAAPSPAMVAVWEETLHQGDSAWWRVLLEDDHATEFRLRINCQGDGDEQWTVTVPVTAPPPGPQVW